MIGYVTCQSAGLGHVYLKELTRAYSKARGLALDNVT